jgi:membrane protease YdiL (CAAX protease family)
VNLEPHCPACGAAFKPDAAFCASCGRRRALVEPGLGFALRLYLALLAIQVIAMVAGQLGASPFRIMVVETAVLAAAVTAIAAARWQLVDAAYRRAGFSALGYAGILLASPLVVIAVSAYVDLLGRTVGVPAASELAGFEGRGLAWLVSVVVIAPPLVEELAFRGLMFGALRKLRRSEMYVISSFAFAMLHLSIPSLLTHMPLGLYLCWLRERSRSMWPSTFAHFCHNLGVVVAELHGWS